MSTLLFTLWKSLGYPAYLGGISQAQPASPEPVCPRKIVEGLTAPSGGALHPGRLRTPQDRDLRCGIPDFISVGVDLIHTTRSAPHICLSSPHTPFHRISIESYSSCDYAFGKTQRRTLIMEKIKKIFFAVGIWPSIAIFWSLTRGAGLASSGGILGQGGGNASWSYGIPLQSCQGR